MPVELWESATAVGPKMQAGEFYSIRNIKLRLNGGGYLEGKMVEGEKITKLDEDELENQPHLVALLQCVHFGGSDSDDDADGTLGERRNGKQR